MTAPKPGEVMDGPLPEGHGARMSEPAPQGVEEGGEYPAMETADEQFGGPPQEASNPEGQQDGYLRLVIDVDDGVLRLTDAAVVDGPLVQTELTGQMAYEALVHGRRVAADAFDDLSQQHGFAPPDDPSIGHSAGETARYQFVARVPLAEVTADELSQMEINLMRPARTTQLAETTSARSGLPLAEAVVHSGEEQPEVVGRLLGVELTESLTPSRAEAVRRRLR
ncbi:MAG TPA: hypothetical protein VFJ14_13115 [Nocardioidaceae bacterium]|nr:hypothetical protein [Nocardioidaceae bacterium]